MLDIIFLVSSVIDVINAVEVVIHIIENLY